jgi:hypothetical protein
MMVGMFILCIIYNAPFWITLLIALPAFVEFVDFIQN